MSAGRIVTGTCGYCGTTFSRHASSPAPVLFCTPEHRKAAANDRQRRNRLARIAQDDPRIARLLAEEQAWAAHKVRERSEEWVFRLDDGNVTVQTSPTTGRWVTLPSTSGGEGIRRVPATTVTALQPVRVVRHGIAATARLAQEGCPA